MSTRTRRWPRSKKLSCWVRPGVFDVRASVLRPVSALIRLDLPTLERPANATSGRPVGGIVSSFVEPLVKPHSAANSRRPRSIASGDGVSSSSMSGPGAGGGRGGAPAADQQLLADRQDVVP